MQGLPRNFKTRGLISAYCSYVRQIMDYVSGSGLVLLLHTPRDWSLPNIGFSARWNTYMDAGQNKAMKMCAKNSDSSLLVQGDDGWTTRFSMHYSRTESSHLSYCPRLLWGCQGREHVCAILSSFRQPEHMPSDEYGAPDCRSSTTTQLTASWTWTFSIRANPCSVELAFSDRSLCFSSDTSYVCFVCAIYVLNERLCMFYICYICVGFYLVYYVCMCDVCVMVRAKRFMYNL